MKAIKFTFFYFSRIFSMFSQLIGVCPLFSEASKSLLVAAGASRN
jgi:hypothetical protein